MKPERAQAIVNKWRAVTTRRLRLGQLKAFYVWLAKAGHVRSNPFDGLVVVGKANRGKPQLRISEAQRFTAAALQRFGEGETFALGALLALLMGLRASEVCNLRVRDVDDNAAVLWVMGTKSTNAQRHLKVPVKLRSLLAQAAADRDPEDRLLGHHRTAFGNLVHRLCDLAKVPRVCPHSLRGLWATLAVESGAASESVAAALGHGSFEMTAKHYATPTSVHSAQSDRVGAALFRDHSEDNKPGGPPTEK